MDSSTAWERAGVKATLATVGIVLAPLLVGAAWIFLQESARMRETRGLRWVVCDQLWNEGQSLVRAELAGDATPVEALRQLALRKADEDNPWNRRERAYRIHSRPPTDAPAACTMHGWVEDGTIVLEQRFRDDVRTLPIPSPTER